MMDGLILTKNNGCSGFASALRGLSAEPALAHWGCGEAMVFDRRLGCELAFVVRFGLRTSPSGP
jgi:hypothetical protein